MISGLNNSQYRHQSLREGKHQSVVMIILVSSGLFPAARQTSGAQFEQQYH